MLLLNFILASTAFSDLVKYTYKNIHEVNKVNILNNNFATGKAKFLRLLEINIKYTYMFCHLKQNKNKIIIRQFYISKSKTWHWTHIETAKGIFFQSSTKYLYYLKPRNCRTKDFPRNFVP